jgi:hypothetical protein
LNRHGLEPFQQSIGLASVKGEDESLVRLHRMHNFTLRPKLSTWPLYSITGSPEIFFASRRSRCFSFFLSLMSGVAAVLALLGVWSGMVLHYYPAIQEIESKGRTVTPWRQRRA